MATKKDVEFRGQIPFLLMALIILLITWVDIKFPLFLFTLRHFMSVEDPEPSEFYLMMQKLSWYVLPIIALGLMVMAIWK